MQMVKVQEEVGELAHEISRGRYDTPEVVDALGDIFVTIIGMCHHLDIEPGYALLTAYHEIKDRKGKVINGSFVKCEDNKMIEEWRKVKGTPTVEVSSFGRVEEE